MEAESRMTFNHSSNSSFLNQNRMKYSRENKVMHTGLSLPVTTKTLYSWEKNLDVPKVSSSLSQGKLQGLTSLPKLIPQTSETAWWVPLAKAQTCDRPPISPTPHSDLNLSMTSLCSRKSVQNLRRIANCNLLEAMGCDRVMINNEENHYKKFPKKKAESQSLLSPEMSKLPYGTSRNQSGCSMNFDARKSATHGSNSRPMSKLTVEELRALVFPNSNFSNQVADRNSSNSNTNQVTSNEKFDKKTEKTLLSPLVPASSSKYTPIDVTSKPGLYSPLAPKSKRSVEDLRHIVYTQCTLLENFGFVDSKVTPEKTAATKLKTLNKIQKQLDQKSANNNLDSQILLPSHPWYVPPLELPSQRSTSDAVQFSLPDRINWTKRPSLNPNEKKTYTKVADKPISRNNSHRPNESIADLAHKYIIGEIMPKLTHLCIQRGTENEQLEECMENAFENFYMAYRAKMKQGNDKK